MAQKVSQQEGAKSDFIQRFAAKYAESVLIRNNKDEEPPPDHERDWRRRLSQIVWKPVLRFYNEFKSLVVVGEYGVGKTALCQMIFNNEDVKSVYAPRIWVSTHSSESGEGLDGKIHVLKRILEGFGVEDSMLASIRTEAKDECMFRQEAGESDGETAKEKELAALLYALHLNLRWKNRRNGFPKGSGGRVIYTTRDKTLAKKLVSEEHEIHRLWPLTDYVSVWKIYEEALKENRTEPPRNSKKCVEELMNKSRGLPLAARLIAEINPMFDDDEYTEQNDFT
ncbi:unnamed protein product [Microthlaspi erraticum]|uniref:NB-ARC domain-containing protein n=1 Tax=Microthlaspi erraticum TaxID=1685480 RepID=A0A6D2J1V5_9BRAS|nr:unnamed protein product [Microthlaspi erraticum]CAA7033851.1 unnamed protein product [Microthlaspi erraticum]